MRYTYNTQNTCATQIAFNIGEDGRVRGLAFEGGCNGNLQAIASLAEGMPASELQAKCAGILCGRRPTSCADQLSLALAQAMQALKE